MKLKIALTLALLLSVGIATFAYVTPQEAAQITAEEEMLAQEGYPEEVIEDEIPVEYVGNSYPYAAPDYYRGIRRDRGPRRVAIERRRR